MPALAAFHVDGSKFVPAHTLDPARNEQRPAELPHVPVGDPGGER
ncbi:hypothetical protein BJQ89_01620 [Arthrobacter sp. ES1]|nr:hypothetical protein [Arthrobacter sp. ES1]